MQHLLHYPILEIFLFELIHDMSRAVRYDAGVSIFVRLALPSSSESHKDGINFENLLFP